MSALVAERRPPAILPALLASLWLIDTAATVCFAMKHGTHMEANPLMRFALEAVGIAGFALIKASVLMLWLSFQHRVRPWVHVLLICLLAPVAYLASVVAWGGT